MKSNNEYYKELKVKISLEIDDEKSAANLLTAEQNLMIVNVLCQRLQGPIMPLCELREELIKQFKEVNSATHPESLRNLHSCLRTS